MQSSRPVFSLGATLICVSLATCLALSACSHHQKTAGATEKSEQRVPSNEPVQYLNAEERQVFDQEMNRLIETNLFEQRAQDQAQAGSEGVDVMNELTLKRIDGYIPAPVTERNGMRLVGFGQVDESVAEAVLESSKVHPIIGDYFHRFYNSQADKQKTDIGFCFGRATYMDRMLGRLGVYQESIRKIWIVGDLKVWQFHVATMVYTNKGWMVLDPHVIGGKLSTPRNWFNQFKLLNVFSSKKARVYISDARKFAAMPGDYELVQMGFKKWENGKKISTSRSHDWYQNYFKDMSRHDVKSANWPRLGLSKLVPSAADARIGVLNPAELQNTMGRYDGDQVQAYQQATEEIKKYIVEEYEKKNQEQYRF